MPPLLATSKIDSRANAGMTEIKYATWFGLAGAALGILALFHIWRWRVAEVGRWTIGLHLLPTAAVIREQQIGGSGGSLEPPGPLS